MDEASSNRSNSAAEAKVDGSDGASQRVVRRLLWLLFPLTLGLAITRQSLWVDEGYTAWFIAHKNISTFFSSLIGSPGAPGDPQMLFYLVYMWVWVKLFGESEWALRAANIPFAGLFMVSLGWAARRLFDQPNLWVLACLSPFFWFYLNEARPYIALMTFSAVAIVALLAYLMYPAEYKASAPYWCLIALLLVSGTHILGMFLFPSMVVLATSIVTRDGQAGRNFLRDWSRPALFCSPAFIALGSFYAWAAANGVNKGLGVKPGLSNIAFVMYEFAGFDGLGPPRGDMRQTPHLKIFGPYCPWLLLGVIAIFGVGLSLSRKRPSRIVWHLIAGFCVGLAVALKISMIEHFQLLGRHVAVFFPLLFATIMLWQKPSFSSGWRRYATAALVALGVVWGISDLRLVYLQKYEKDAYRGAASIALVRARLDGGEILWAADPHTAYYYGIKVIRDGRSADIGRDEGIDWPVICEAVDAEGWSVDKATEYLKTNTKPVILVLSKANPFDMHGAWNALIQKQRPADVAHLTAFSIYEWPAKVTARQ